LFHELGHAIHNLTSSTRYSVFHGPSGARDWVEIPSIFLENWLWDPTTLKKIGKHYSTLSPELHAVWIAEGGGEVSAEVDEGLVEALAKTRYVNAALGVMRSSHTIAFDMKVHSPASREEAVNMCGRLPEMWNRSLVELTGMEAGEAIGLGRDWGIGCSRMGMYMRGYDAGTWAYVLFVPSFFPFLLSPLPFPSFS
jgi:metallopeptidase MepB